MFSVELKLGEKRPFFDNMVKYEGSYLQCERPLCWNLRKIKDCSCLHKPAMQPNKYTHMPKHCTQFDCLLH